MKPYLLCPTCESDDIIKNGTTRRGKQNYKCRECGRQFVENPQWQPKSPDTKTMIDRLLLEKIPLAGIARVMRVSEAWLQQYVNQVYAEVPQEVEVVAKPQQRLTVQMDELWSFVDDIVLVRLQKLCGSLYLRSIVNVRCVIAISGQLIRWHYQASVIELWAKRVVKQAILSDSTIH